VERLVHGVQFVGFGGQPTASLHSMGLFVLFVSVFEAAHKVSRYVNEKMSQQFLLLFLWQITTAPK
jgi:hypothetical protein